MRFEYFGDSYDIVKKSLIAWLGDYGQWAAHPMFTEYVPADKANMFSRFLGAKLLSTETLTPKTDRAAYFDPCKGAANLFLDPDTGVCLRGRRGARSVNYVFGQELVSLCKRLPSALTLVFDQSYSRGNQKSQVAEKLSVLASQGVYGFAYCSHATFLLLGGDTKVVGRVHSSLLRASGLPSWRLVTLDGSTV
jgi:hypothetical protein